MSLPNKPKSTGRVWNGKRIARTSPGKFPGPGKIGEIIDCLNALLTAWVRTADGKYGRAIIADNGTVYEIPKGAVGTSETGGGGAARYRVKSVQGDYITCHTWDGTTEGATDTLIAKPPHLRHSLTSQTVDGESVTYSAHAIDGGICTRTASASGFADQDEIVIPQYQIGSGQDSEIWADTPESGTGVSGTTLMDTNRDARAWCQIPTA